MTTITYYIDDNEFNIEARGHAQFAEVGSDIVCAGISTLLQSLIAYLDNDEYDIGEGKLWCYGVGEKAVACASMVIKGLRMLESSFPDHVRVVEGCTIHRNTTLI